MHESALNLKKQRLLVTKCLGAGLLIASCFLSACTSVQAYQKEHLAAAHMSFNPTPLESVARQHMYTSREAASGGYGISGGGCGCN